MQGGWNGWQGLCRVGGVIPAVVVAFSMVCNLAYATQPVLAHAEADQASAVSSKPAASAVAEDHPVLRIFSNSFVPAGKFRQLQPFAEAAGVRLEHVNVEHAARQPAEWLAGADVFLLDVPRPSDREQVEAALGDDWRQPGRRWLRVGGGAPGSEGLDAAASRRLAAYYAAGGEQNFRHFFAYAAALLQGQDVSAFPAPESLPATGFYHPAASAVFPTLDAYFAWGRERWAPESGTVAFLVHGGAIGDLQTQAIDTLVSKTEAAGMRPVVFWFDESAARLPDVLGKGQIDALVNMGHLQDGKARSEDFLTLDIPVLQTTTFRQEPGGEGWNEAASGMPPRTLAIFLAAPEGWGMMDPLVLRASVRGEQQLLPEQADALIAKVQGLVALRHEPAERKKLALLFWNYPQGEKNLAASNLNLPRSIVAVAQGLAAAGYRVDTPEEQRIIDAGQEMLGALYRKVPLETLLQHGLAAAYPVQRYQQWLKRLPAAQRRALAHGGDPASHWAVRDVDGVPSFIIPVLKLGNLVVMPQMPRGAEPGKHYHDTASAPDHLYMAAYLYLREALGVHALIHMGTHGTQEWLPGKDRGLAATDFPFLTVGDVPVFYPYLQDNVGEAIQAKRRGRAVIISHQTPPFAPAGLYDTLADLHQLIHEYQQLDEGAAQAMAQYRILQAAAAAHMLEDLDWQPAEAARRFPEFLQVLHDHLHELSRAAMPLGLHTFGSPAVPEHRLMTVMQQLGEPYYQALGQDDGEWLAADAQAVQQSEPYQFLALHLRDTDGEKARAAVGNLAGPGTTTGQLPGVLSMQGAGHDSAVVSGPKETRRVGDVAELDGSGVWGSVAQVSPDSPLAGYLLRARQLDAALADPQELEALLAGLEGRFVPPGAGGDPLRNPDIASGRNLYAFEADKIPSPAAYAAGGEAFAQLLQAYADSHDGAMPDKLAFSLWSSEAIRHLGVTEAQVLHALGLRPVWGRGGRLEALDIIPAAELGRPRVDAVIQVTGVYRDQFDGFMRLLADAMERLAVLDEPGNRVAQHTREVEAALLEAGLAPQEASLGARLRIFGNAPGAYGTGVPDLTLQADAWEDGSDLARQFLNSSRYAYGTGSWGQAPGGGSQILEAQLGGVQAVVMSRSSNLHGVLSTDHPFEFMGGLSAAIRHIDGQAPELLVSDLRQARPRTTSLQKFLADEMRTRYLNPAWIQGMKAEGYAGTLSVLGVTNNLYGWQAMDASTVRDDQWQAMFDTYVADTRNLGMQEWFEESNPNAQAQMLERMAEAVRKGFWDAPEETRRQMAQRWKELQEDHAVEASAKVTREYLANMLSGYGLSVTPVQMESAAASVPDSGQSQPSPQQDDNQADVPLAQVSGQELREVSQNEDNPDMPFRMILALALMVVLLLAGAWQALRENKRLARINGQQAFTYGG